MRRELPVSGYQLTRRMRRAFSFTEILFAVIILGLGFIMVAAIFPVALQQAKSTTEEISGTSIARSATNYLGEAFLDNGGGTLSNCPPGANVPGSINPTARQAGVASINLGGGTSTFDPSLWDRVRGNTIFGQDPRYGWIFLYSRAGDPASPANRAPYVQVFVFPVETRAAPVFKLAADTVLPSPPVAPSTTIDETLVHVPNLWARRVQVSVADSADTSPWMQLVGGAVDLIAFSDPGDLRGLNLPNNDGNMYAVVEGAYVVIADDQLPSPNRGLYNGRLFKLGAHRTDIEASATPAFPNIPSGKAKLIYELQPGNDFTPESGVTQFPGATTPGADAYVVGKGYSPSVLDAYRNGQVPAVGQPWYEGASMANGAYVTYVKVK